MAGTMEQQVSLFLQAREHVHSTIRGWHTGDLVMALPQENPLQTNICARIFAWATIVSGLATKLNDLATQIGGGMSYGEAVIQARELVAAAVAELWPSMRLLHLPFRAHLGATEEYEIYRLGANALAVQLGQLSQQCFRLALPDASPFGSASLATPSSEGSVENSMHRKGDADGSDG